ncbi:MULTISPECIES: hypothetical protein [Pontibacillus]|uniref:Uncharacterized protein n=1 Tax=Pontibacillus chungwhensis TaxID=265426 RepID=A0ABY8V0I2_9BACI|nr:MULTISPECIES: hypothetical protein [Pontibacillus]MCD5324698.1 hypothetical protein [Pontibacillus sp. HN14]WIF99008.1 hypothetical protein QNI29_04965 [Pontibacillus chungwhensis]
MSEKSTNQPRDFESFLFGRREPNKSEEVDSNKETDSSFDLIDTTETLMETYRQLSPYIKELSALFKKTK